MLRRHGVIVGFAAAITALGTAAYPAVAGQAPMTAPTAAQTVQDRTPAPEVPAAMLEAMQRDLGLTRAEAKERIADEHHAGQTETALRKDLGDKLFAGSWLTGADAELVVATTGKAAARGIEKAGATAKVVDHSLRDLNSVRSGLDRAAGQDAPTGASVWYVDVKTNSVVVLASKASAAKAFVQDSGVDADAVRIVKSDETPRTFYNLRGGDAYYMGGGRCSVGFSITRGSQGGFATAGHCGTTGTSTTGYNQVAQGQFAGSSFPGNDYAWVSTNSNWTPTATVKGQSGDVQVAGSTVAPVGSSICRSGSTTGWHCGSVQQLNASVSYPQGTVNGLTRTSVCAEPGDSGGSFISGNQAQGVTSGGSGNCSSGGTTYFQPLNEILQTYGLTLKTTGGGGEEPPADCETSKERMSGSLSSGGSAIQPDGSYFQSAAGAHRGCLAGPSGADFDLYLQKWNGSSWASVASGVTASADETVTYTGTSGYYRYVVHAYSGSGSYTFGMDRP